MKNSGKTVSVLRDTGSSAVGIRSNLVLDSEYTGKKEMVILIDGTARILPTAMVEVNTPFFSGKAEAIVVDNPIYDVIIGNIPGARNTSDPDPKWESYAVGNETSDSSVTEPKIKSTDSDELDSKVKPDTVYSQAVVTLNQAEKLKQPIKPLKTPSAISEISPTNLGKAQKEDESLSGCWERAKHPTKHMNTKQVFLIHKGWLFRRKCDPNDTIKGCGPKQLVVPSNYRTDIMKVAHETLLSGHLGTKKTMDKICTQFYWPGVQQDISNFCKSCDVCQWTISKGRVAKAALGKMPLIDTPFRRIAMDLVGPINPASERGHLYILTVIDFSTRYPEACPLKGISTEEVSEALVDIYSRMGIYPMKY